MNPSYVGIDLGTTNSAICSFDGEGLRLYKSPEQNDVTPSAIFIDKRGNKFVGKHAYDNAARNPDNAATLFKRHMGTSTPIPLKAAGMTMTPEQCSAEVLKVVFGYLPDSIRRHEGLGTVITVPAAFNQMQKDATMTAAEIAGIGRVALMQEPVAAIMSVMRQRKGDGIFLVYDLGGGTLDIAIGESISGRASLLAHGGIAMCGGRDFDRALLDNVVKPWLLDNFDLPQDFVIRPEYTTLRHLATWATERTKIELSTRESAVIALDDSELRMKDQAGKELYLDIALSRSLLDNLIAEKVAESVQAARSAMEKVGLNSHDVQRIVFVGGPTQYKPLRDKVAFELGISPSIDINPMTAVAEGAALFAESIDWSSESKGRKGSKGAIKSGGPTNLSISFIARTPDTRAKISVTPTGPSAAGSELQIDSLDTGWSSGRVAITSNTVVQVPLQKPGANTFKLFVFDPSGGPEELAEDKITISRTAAQIDAIPASHSIGIEVREKLGGRMVLAYLVREGDQLPKFGKMTFKAEESLRAGATGSIKFKLWEGEASTPISDNRFIGLFEIKGSDFDEGVIPKGAELVCKYEIQDSGRIALEVTVPSVSGSFVSDRNLYSRQEGQIDFTKASRIIAEESDNTIERLEGIAAKIRDPKLEQARGKLQQASTENANADPERAKEALDRIQEAKMLIALARKEHLKEIREMELDRLEEFFSVHIRPIARPTDISIMENLLRTARRAITNNSADFEGHIDELRGKNFQILWRQEWFVIDRFKQLSDDAHLFLDETEHMALVEQGQAALQANDIEKLRGIVAQLMTIRIGSSGDDQLLTSANILQG